MLEEIEKAENISLVKQSLNFYGFKNSDRCRVCDIKFKDTLDPVALERDFNNRIIQGDDSRYFQQRFSSLEEYKEYMQYFCLDAVILPEGYSEQSSKYMSLSWAENFSKLLDNYKAKEYILAVVSVDVKLPVSKSDDSISAGAIPCIVSERNISSLLTVVAPVSRFRHSYARGVTLGSPESSTEPVKADNLDNGSMIELCRSVLSKLKDTDIKVYRYLSQGEKIIAFKCFLDKYTLVSSSGNLYDVDYYDYINLEDLEGSKLKDILSQRTEFSLKGTLQQCQLKAIESAVNSYDNSKIQHFIDTYKSDYPTSDISYYIISDLDEVKPVFIGSYGSTNVFPSDAGLRRIMDCF